MFLFLYSVCVFTGGKFKRSVTLEEEMIPLLDLMGSPLLLGDLHQYLASSYYFIAFWCSFRLGFVIPFFVNFSPEKIPGIQY